jgi:hypothetical protein
MISAVFVGIYKVFRELEFFPAKFGPLMDTVPLVEILAIKNEIETLK